MKQILAIAQAVGCRTRLALLHSLGERGCSLTETARKMNLSASTTAYHLAILVQAGLATRTVRGRECIYAWSRNRWQLVLERPPAVPVTEGELA